MYVKVIGCIALALAIISCKSGASEVEESTDDNSVLFVDHVNIWIENPDLAKKKLTDIGFASVPDSISEVHHGQGTSGRYFHFFNSYLELIFIEDSSVFQQNCIENRNLDFNERAHFYVNGASPFGVALRMKNYGLDHIPFPIVDYHQSWMPYGSRIYAAEESKKNLKEPSVFVVYPEIEAELFEAYSDLERIPEEYAFAREFYKHPNGAKKMTNVVIHSNAKSFDSQVSKIVQEINTIQWKSGSDHLMELTFDNGRQKKTFDLRPDLPLIIHL